METVLLVIHIMVVLALVAVVLLQRSEGGALGIGGGGGGGFFSSRGTANLLTRTTAILAGVFFLTSIGLTFVGSRQSGTDSLLERVLGTDPLPGGAPGAPAIPGDDATRGSGQGILDTLRGPGDAAAPPAPEAPAAPTGPQVPSGD
jgi:preprotein translocase subunit SecG